MNDFERIREALRGRYDVERLLGTGGMASVFLATDPKHDRLVALKVMHRELAASLGPERFLREIGITARLSHPHILPVHDSGESGGLLWYVMPFVDGESLQARIAREGPLPVGDAVRIAREVGDALDHAHRHGIIHRDIKPANILLADGHALVADFGIARAVRTGGEGEAITRTGFAVGTAQYMSPEQATGSGDVDGRTDIFALAVVLHEMLAGTPPFNGASMQAILVQVLTGTPSDLTATREGVPAPLADLVRRSLARDPADRPHDAGAMRDALQRLEADLVTASKPTVARRAARRPAGTRVALLAGGIALVAVAAAVLTRGSRGSDGQEAPRRLAVLPFTYQGTAEDTLLAEGIVDEVRGKLSRVQGLAVLASTSTDDYRGSGQPPQEIARELRAGYLLVGRVRWAGAGPDRKVQVTSEIISGESGLTQWARTFDAAVSDVFAVQAALASQVALAIGAELAPNDSRELAERPTASLAAWNLYLQAKAAPAWESKLRLLEQAVAIDSTFAEAWGLIVDVASNTYWNQARDPALIPRARHALTRVQALRPGSALAHASASYYYDGPDRNLDRALAHADSAVALEPGSAELLAMAAGFDIEKGRVDSAVERLQRARQLDPRSARTLGALQRLLLFTRRLPEAVTVSEELEALVPQHPMAAWRHSLAHAARGDLPAARATIRNAMARGISAPVLASHFAGYLETGWLLDSTEQQLLYRLTPASFDDDRSWWALSLATAHWDAGNHALARTYADSALAPTRAEMEQDSSILETRLLYGLMLAYLGRASEALAEVAYVEDRLDDGMGSEPAYELEIMARIYTVTGHKNEAIAALRRVLGLPWHITGAWLRLDPAFAPLRDEPGFREMVRE